MSPLPTPPPNEYDYHTMGSETVPDYRSINGGTTQTSNSNVQGNKPVSQPRTPPVDYATPNTPGTAGSAGSAGAGKGDLSSAQSALNKYSFTPYNFDINSVNPENSLDYQAFLRGMGLEQSTAQAQAAMQQGQVEAGLHLQLPEIQREEGLGITSANNQAALAGSANSSARLTADTNVTNAANYETASAQQQAAQQIAQSQFGLQSTMAGLQTQQSEAALQAQQSLLQTQNQVAAQQNLAQLYGIQGFAPGAAYGPDQFNPNQVVAK